MITVRKLCLISVDTVVRVRMCEIVKECRGGKVSKGVEAQHPSY